MGAKAGGIPGGAAGADEVVMSEKNRIHHIYKNPCKSLVVVESKAVIQWRGKWWSNGQPGPLMQRLVNEVPAIGDGALWRLPMTVTGCKSLGQLDRDGWDYQNVKERVAAVVVYAKGEQSKYRNHDAHRVVHNRIYQIPAKCGDGV